MLHSFYEKISSNTTLKNFSILGIANLASQSLSLFSSIRVAPLLGPADYGYYNYILVLAAIFSIVSTFGLRIVLIRSIAREPEQTRRYFFRSLLIRLFFLCCSFIIFIAYINVGENAARNTLSITAIIILITTATLWDTIESASFGNQIMKISALIDFAFSLVWVIAIYLIPESLFKVALILIVHVSIQILKNVSYFLWLIRSNLLSKTSYWEKPLINIPTMLRQSSSFFLLAMFTCLQNQIPLLFLAQNSDLSQVGIFNLGYRILSPLQMLINTALTALFPNLSVLAMKNPVEFRDRCKKGIIVIILTGIVGCLIFTVFSRELILLLYKESFEQSARIISIQCWYTAFYGVFSFIGAVWGASNKQLRLALFSGLGTFISMPILWIGSTWGSEGLAFAFIIMALINMSYHWYFFASKTFSRNISGKYSIFLWTVFLVYMIIGIAIPQDMCLLYKTAILLCLLAPIIFYSQNKIMKYALK